MADLAAVLGARPPEEFAQLSADETAHLAAALQSAITHRSELIDTSIQESLKHLPRPVRGAVKRVLGM